MSIKTKAVILALSAVVLMFMVVGGMDGVRASSNDGAYRQLQVYSEVLSRVRSEYVEEPNIPVVTTGALHGLLESLDANSSYISPSEYALYKSHQTEAKADIGAAISKRFGYASGISVIPGGPADKAAIRPVPTKRLANRSPLSASTLSPRVSRRKWRTRLKRCRKRERRSSS